MLPWHFGGDPYLTYAEIESYAAKAKDLNDARKQAAARQRARR